jgi:hypothetical protein
VRLELDRDAPPADPWLTGGLGSAALAALFAAALFPFHALPTLCAFKLATGHPCMACGMTRSWIHVMHGHGTAAILQNPLGTALAVTAILSVAYLALRQVLRVPAVRLRTSSREAWSLRISVAALVVVNWGYVWIADVA